jgi:hypothetical protein
VAGEAVTMVIKTSEVLVAKSPGRRESIRRSTLQECTDPDCPSVQATRP